MAPSFVIKKLNNSTKIIVVTFLFDCLTIKFLLEKLIIFFLTLTIIKKIKICVGNLISKKNNLLVYFRKNPYFKQLLYIYIL